MNSPEKMKVEGMRKLIDEMDVKTRSPIRQGMAMALEIAIWNGGFASYKMAIIVANAAGQTLLSRGLSLAPMLH